MKRIQHYIEYQSLRWFARLVRALPLEAARFTARRLADFVFYLAPIRKKVVLANLAESFKDGKSPAQLREIARKTYQQFSQTMMELLFSPKLSGAELLEMVAFENTAVLDRALRGGRGAVLVGAHFGNWEFMGAALAQRYPMTFVVGQQQNRQVDDLLNSFRLGKGIKLIPLKLALRGVLKALKANGFIAILADQDAHEDGAFVDFFGRPASTPKGPALFALRAGCPLITGHIFRQDDGRFRVVFEEVPRPATGSEAGDIEQYTAAFTKILETHTREHPDHWFWMHRRWKTKRPV